MIDRDKKRSYIIISRIPLDFFLYPIQWCKHFYEVYASYFFYITQYERCISVAHGTFNQHSVSTAGNHSEAVVILFNLTKYDLYRTRLWCCCFFHENSLRIQIIFAKL